MCICVCAVVNVINVMCQVVNQGYLLDFGEIFLSLQEFLVCHFSVPFIVAFFAISTNPKLMDRPTK